MVLHFQVMNTRFYINLILPSSGRFINQCVSQIHIKDIWRYTMVYARITLNDYANKVLNVIKAKFDLRDKSEALNKFIDLFGDEVVEKEAKDEYVKKILEMEKRHFQKYGQRKMTLSELHKICGVD